MRLCKLPITLWLTVVSTVSANAFWDEPAVFSGPQPGELISDFPALVILPENAPKSSEPENREKTKNFASAESADAVIALIIAHKRTRPAFGLSRAVLNMVVQRNENRSDEQPTLIPRLVFLSADRTEATDWMQRTRHYFPTAAEVGLSADGAEGPGAWGLNRDVELTIIVARDGKTLNNFALVQPSLSQDAPRIFSAIVDASGGGEVPSVDQFVPGMGRRDMNSPSTVDDGQLRTLLGPLIQKEASEEQVRKAAAKVETAMTDNPALKKRIMEIARRIIQAGKLENYGTPAAQETLKMWATRDDEPSPRSP